MARLGDLPQQRLNGLHRWCLPNHQNRFLTFPCDPHGITSDFLDTHQEAQYCVLDTTAKPVHRRICTTPFVAASFFRLIAPSVCPITEPWASARGLAAH